jgi:hypothetical protein
VVATDAALALRLRRVAAAAEDVQKSVAGLKFIVAKAAGMAGGWITGFVRPA